MTDKASPTGRATNEPSPDGLGLPVGIPDAGKAACANCVHVRTFKPRRDERDRWDFPDIGWECRKPDYEGYTSPFGCCSFYSPAKAIEARHGRDEGSVHESASREGSPEGGIDG